MVTPSLRASRPGVAAATGREIAGVQRWRTPAAFADLPPAPGADACLVAARSGMDGSAARRDSRYSRREHPRSAAATGGGGAPARLRERDAGGADLRADLDRVGALLRRGQ